MSENMNETMNENEGVTVTLTLDNDETLECAVDDLRSSRQTVHRTPSAR